MTYFGERRRQKNVKRTNMSVSSLSTRAQFVNRIRGGGSYNFIHVEGGFADKSSEFPFGGNTPRCVSNLNDLISNCDTSPCGHAARASSVGL